MKNLNRKGYYTERITLIKQEQTDDRIKRQENVGKEKKIRKTKAPKEIAREARERKKAYISLLEGRNEELKVENDLLKRRIVEMRNEYEQLANSKGNKYDERLFQQFKHLTTLLENKNRHELRKRLNVLKDKFGLTGEERVVVMDKTFDEIMKYPLPMYYRLLMENCQDQQKFYSLLGITKELKLYANLGEKEKTVIVKLRPQIVRHREVYDRIMNELNQLRLKLHHVNFECQKVVNRIQETMTPEFVGHLLVGLDNQWQQENLNEIYPMNYWKNTKQNANPTLQMKMFDEEEILREFQHDLNIFDSIYK